MSSSDTTFDEVLALARRLPPQDQVRLIAQLVPITEIVPEQNTPLSVPSSRRSLRGLLADLGNAPSEDEITAAQREMWQAFGDETR